MRDINKYTDDYKKQDFEVYQVEYRRKKIIEQIDKYNPKKILEIGCGIEPLFLYVEDREWVIVEPSIDFCENARKKISQTDHVSIIHGFLEERVTELRKENYDMIICAALLQEVENPDQILQDIFTLCGKKTIVHINVANAKSFHRILGRNMGIANEYELTERNILFQQNMVYDMESLEGLLKSHNFDIINQGSCFIKPFTHRQMDGLMEKEIINREILDGLYNMTNDFPMLGSEIFVNCRKTNSNEE